jgi:hypothetical protein
MKRMPGRILALLPLILLVGCASHQTVMVPPRIDLTQHELIGLIEFSSSSAEELVPLATRRFTDLARQDQGLVRILEFGPEKELLASVGQDQWGTEAIRALGREHGVQTVLIGELEISDVRPDLSVSGALRSGSLSAKVEATLAVRLVETSTGASIWSRSAVTTASLGHLTVLGNKEIVFDAADPDGAYGAMIDVLVDQVTRDFRVSWVRRRVG